MNTNKITPKPSLLSNDLINAISECVLSGLTAQQTIDALSIGKTSFYRWLSQGELDESEGRESIQRDLWHAIKKSRAKTIQNHLENISSHSSQAWQASAWILERVYGYRRDSDVNVTVNQGYEQPEALVGASLEDINKMLLALNDGDEEIEPSGFNKP